MNKLIPVGVTPAMSNGKNLNLDKIDIDRIKFSGFIGLDSILSTPIHIKKMYSVLEKQEDQRKNQVVVIKDGYISADLVWDQRSYGFINKTELANRYSKPIVFHDNDLEILLEKKGRKKA